jgi:hypothetical protein
VLIWFNQQIEKRNLHETVLATYGDSAKNKANDLSHPVLWHSKNCNLERKNLRGNVTVANEINSFRILSKDLRDSKIL